MRARELDTCRRRRTASQRCDRQACPLRPVGQPALEGVPSALYSLRRPLHGKGVSVETVDQGGEREDRRVARTCAPVAGVYDHEGRRRFESFFFGRTKRINNCGPVPAEGRAEDELDLVCGSEFGESAQNHEHTSLWIPAYHSGRRHVPQAGPQGRECWRSWVA